MGSSKNTKRALFTSIMSLVLCVAMLIGTTFAWFTDSVSTGVNKIQSGTLDVTLEYWDGDSWEDAVNESLFNYDLWEPGYMVVQGLRVNNAGKLALEWKASLSSTKEISILGEVIDVYYKTGEYSEPENREEVKSWTKAGSLAEFIEGIETTTTGSLEAGESAELGIALVMREDAGNDYQNLDLGGDITLTILATQFTVEEDSFDEYYDEDADYNEYTQTIELDEIEEPITLDENTILIANENGTTIEADSNDYDTNYSAIMIDGNVKVKVVGELEVIGAENGDGINVPEGSMLTLTGDTLTAVGNAGSDGVYANNSTPGGSGIGNAKDSVGAIYITDMESLTANGYGKGGFGIGGNMTGKLRIENTSIVEVSGGFVQKDFINDTSYGSTEPEGGAAIGIGNGATSKTVVLKGVHIKKAEGGSKAAAIGAQFWASCEITIEDCEFVSVIGGNASAGIGGSRIPDDEFDTVTLDIVIKRSTILSVIGGMYGAAIGSGYNTNTDEACNHTCNIEISASTIDAEGGAYAAGIGTGYHVAVLTGFIDGESDINAENGGSRDKYTNAQDIGYGVIDLDREGSDMEVTFTVDGDKIDIPTLVTGE